MRYYLAILFISILCFSRRSRRKVDGNMTPYQFTSAYEDPPLPFPNDTCTPLCKLTLKTLNMKWTQVITEAQLTLRCNVTNDYFRTVVGNTVGGYIENEITHSEVLGIQQVEIVGTSIYSMTSPWSLIRNVTSDCLDLTFGRLDSEFRIYIIVFLAVQIVAFMMLSLSSLCILCCFSSRVSDVFLRGMFFCVNKAKRKKSGDDDVNRRDYERISDSGD